MMSRRSKLFRQRHLPFVGVFKMLLSGAVSWITLAIFVFSAISAWNTSTVLNIRFWLPWLNLYVFVGVVVCMIFVAMWLEYKFIQPSVMVFWNRMFYNHGSELRNDVEAIKNSQKDIDNKLDTLTELVRENGSKSKQ